MANIALLSKGESYMTRSLAEKIKNFGHNVVAFDETIKSLTNLNDSFSALIIYADSDFSENSEVVIYLKDRLLELETPVFIIADKEEIEKIEKVLPKTCTKKSYPRPFNVTDVAENLDGFIRSEDALDKKTILVVDDSGAYLRNLKSWLEPRYKVVPVNSGMKAINYISVHKPDLVLLDYEMPVADGRQVLEMIRTEHEFEKLPVIFLTGKGDKESVMKVMALKPDGYLLKTMPADEIIKNVDEFFAKQKAKM